MDRRDLLRLLGGAAVVPALTGLSSAELLALGQRLHALPASGAPFRPRALDPHQARTVAALADLIIPETDTPGAAAAGVDGFVNLILAEWYADDQRQRFLDGLADLDVRSRARWGAEFVDVEPGAQVDLLTELDAEAEALREAERARAREDEERVAEERVAEEPPPRPAEEPPRAEQELAGDEEGPRARDHFFRQMKWLTLYGYYTSPVGVHEELRYVIIPGGYDPCAELVPRTQGGS